MKVSQLIKTLQEIHSKAWCDMEVIIDDSHEGVYKGILSIDAQQLDEGAQDLVITIM